MASAELAHTIIGIIGNITALVLFTSPAKTFVQIWKKGSVEQFSAIPYLATLFNCGMWVLYGLPMFHPKSLLVLTVNGSGFVIELVFLVLYMVYSNSREQRLKVAAIMVVELIILGVIGLMVGTLVKSVIHRTTIIGSICVFGCFLMYASPLTVMKIVIRTKSVKYMPFLLSLFSFLNGLCWSIYALIRFDPYLLVPNAVGCLLGIAQLILYGTYYKSTKLQQVQVAKQHKIGTTEMAAAHEVSMQPPSPPTV